MDSSDLPLVSGNHFHTKIKCISIIAEKKRKAIRLPFCISATIGKVHEITAAINQWVKLPREPPCERTALGNISEMNTQMTAPWEKAKKAIKPIR